MKIATMRVMMDTEYPRRKMKISHSFTPPLSMSRGWSRQSV